MHGDTLGARIYNARRDRGWRQKDLAAAVSVEPHTVSRWERDTNSPPVETLARIAAALGKPIGYFVTEALPSLDGSQRNEDLRARLVALEAGFVRLSDEVARLADCIADQQLGSPGQAHDRSREDQAG